MTRTCFAIELAAPFETIVHSTTVHELVDVMM